MNRVILILATATGGHLGLPGKPSGFARKAG